jgi:4-hydroxybenzoate decarboxylase subunit C
MFPDLRSFIDQLRRDRDLVEITSPVEADLEAAEIHRRVIAAGGPALLFTNVRGKSFPLVTNLFGTARRAELAFGQRPLRLIKDLVHLAETILPPTPGKLWGARGLAAEILKVGVKRESRGPVTEVVAHDFRIDALPVLTCWPEDGGPFVTLPLVYTTHPDGKGSNLAMYRLHVHDARTTGMHWQIGKGGGFHYQVAEGRGLALPATVFLGGPPALILAAIAPLPENVPELMLGSLIAGRRLPQVPGPNGHPHPLVATAEFALMGEVPPHVRRPEGPFGDHYGYYSLRHDYPEFRIAQVAHRRDAIYPATVVGKPRQEDFYIGDLLQELLSPLFPLVMPAVEQLWSYGETGYHSLAAAVVKQRYKREAMSSAFRILGEGQLSLTKFLFLTDRPVNLKDFRATLEHVLARTDPRADLYVFSNLSMDTLDYTGPTVNEGSKGVWLGLGDPVRELPRVFVPPQPPPAEVRDIRVFCGGCLLVEGPRYGEDASAGARLAAHPAFAGWPLVVLTDDAARAIRSEMNFLWTTFTRFEPAADIYAAGARVVRHHVSYEAPVVIDARMKPWYPDELSCRPDVAERVTARWKEYFPSARVEMGDSERGHLD